jgi:uncharacterized membrane protein YeaQ/YmgE (transglycosylase-associated protein family)
MTATGIVTALVVGLSVGVLGRRPAPGRQHVPRWLTIAVGIVAALLGSMSTSLLTVDVSGFTLLELVVQVVLAALAVVTVMWTTGRPEKAAHARSIGSSGAR